MNQDTSIWQQEKLCFVFHHYHCTRFRPNSSAILRARWASAADTVLRNSLCFLECQAGQNSVRRLTFTPGNSDINQFAMGFQQQSK